MSGLNFKEFLTCGIFLQTAPDLFKLVQGPFLPISENKAADAKVNTLFYRSDFWSFLSRQGESAQNFVYSEHAALSLNREEFIRLLSRYSASRPELSWEVPSEQEFKAQFDWSRIQFKKGILKKTVPIIKQSSASYLNFENKIWMLKSLIGQNQYGWSYGIFSEEKSVLGHTPEILARWTASQQSLSTVALAGTYAKTPEASAAILHDTKIREEHQIVIEDIEKILLAGKHIFEKSETKVLELKYLLHLLTEFNVRAFERTQVLDLIRQLHPTAAMGIYPRRSDLFEQFSKFKLQQQRGFFAGPLALIEPESLWAVVAIRNIIFDKQQVDIYSGCGITVDSDYDKELLELENKRNSVKKMLGLMND